jgi:hypothetical protein
LIALQTVPSPTHQAADPITTEVRAAAALTTSYVATTALDCHGYEAIDFFVSVATAGALTKITLKFEAAAGAANFDPAAGDYAPYLTETVASGVATTNVYQVELADPTIADGERYVVTVPVRGRWVRAAILGDAAAGSVSVEAMRRPFGEI